MSTAADSPRGDRDAASSNPFKLLDPYTKKDRLFGRDGDVVLVVARIASARTTLLFSGTGIGKTSFLQAKLIPHLEREYRIILFSRWTGNKPAADQIYRNIGAAQPERFQMKAAEVGVQGQQQPRR